MMRPFKKYRSCEEAIKTCKSKVGSYKIFSFLIERPCRLSLRGRELRLYFQTEKKYEKRNPEIKDIYVYYFRTSGKKKYVPKMSVEKKFGPSPRSGAA